MEKVSILIDGNFARLMLKDFLGKNPSVNYLKEFCLGCIKPTEELIFVKYYDCPPPEEPQLLPISKKWWHPKKNASYWMAKKFNEKLSNDSFFKICFGEISFDGWKVCDEFVEKTLKAPRPATDLDFEPILTQKQVDVWIAIDIIKKTCDRIILITADSDFVPAILEAKGEGKKTSLVTGCHLLVKKSLKRACEENRRVFDAWPISQGCRLISN
jgi:uncharacterized LabA/DUF88 family protein